MILQEGDLVFEFSDAIDGFKFDEQNRSDPNFHGLSHCGLKAVDFVVELEDRYLFVEVKNPPVPSDLIADEKFAMALAQKYRDSFLYRWAEEKTDKPVYFLCLVEIEESLTAPLTDLIKRMLPAQGPRNRWTRQIVKDCAALNTARWNNLFPAWQITKP